MYSGLTWFLFFFSSRRRHTRSLCDWSSDVCSSDLVATDAIRIVRSLALVKNFSVSDACHSMRAANGRSEEHTSELQSHSDLVCRLLLEKKKIKIKNSIHYQNSTVKTTIKLPRCNLK